VSVRAITEIESASETQGRLAPGRADCGRYGGCTQRPQTSPDPMLDEDRARLAGTCKGANELRRRRLRAGSAFGGFHSALRLGMELIDRRDDRSEGRRRTKVMGPMAGETAGLSLIHAVLVDASKRWHGVDVSSYLMEKLDALRATIAPLAESA